MAFAKGALGPAVEWIGARPSIEHGRVVLTAKPQMLEETQALAAAIAASNVVSRKTLRTFVGKVQAIASFVFALRPFLQELYGALYAEPESAAPGCPPSCVWLRMIQGPLDWLQAFFRQAVGNLRVTYDPSAWASVGPPVRIWTDASPWGMGGVLIRDAPPDPARRELRTASRRVPCCAHRPPRLAGGLGLRADHTGGPSGLGRGPDARVRDASQGPRPQPRGPGASSGRLLQLLPPSGGSSYTGSGSHAPGPAEQAVSARQDLDDPSRAVHGA